MLKFLKRALLILGAAVIVAAAILLLWEARLRADSLSAIVTAAVNSQFLKADHYASTINGVWLAGGIGVVGGLLLGLGIGMPSATFKQRFEKAQAAEAQKDPTEAPETKKDAAEAPEAKTPETSD